MLIAHFSMKTSLGNINSFYLGDEAWTELKKLILKAHQTSKVFLLVDEKTHKYCLPLLIKNIPELKTARAIKIKNGEENKTIETCKHVWEALNKNDADRKTLLINLGGGMIGDLGGFSASAYMRGIDFINVPTTLLAMVDASVGGKTGVNFDHYKNLIGFFNQPVATFIFPEFLKTLPGKELLSGFSEVIKHALIVDKKYWQEIKSIKTIDHKSVAKLISHSISIKSKIVKKDPTEKGERKKLNFGHTTGHAIESYSIKKDKITVLHGEAVAIGMICESYLSYKKGMLNKASLDEITSFILSKYKHYAINNKAEKEIMQLMQHDKKNERKKINFTLLKNIGNAQTDNYCDPILIKESLNYYRLAKEI